MGNRHCLSRFSAAVCELCSYAGLNRIRKRGKREKTFSIKKLTLAMLIFHFTDCVTLSIYALWMGRSYRWMFESLSPSDFMLKCTSKRWSMNGMRVPKGSTVKTPQYHPSSVLSWLLYQQASRVAGNIINILSSRLLHIHSLSSALTPTQEGHV